MSWTPIDPSASASWAPDDSFFTVDDVAIVGIAVVGNAIVGVGLSDVPALWTPIDPSASANWNPED